jgi:hypothetical protein
VCVCMYVPGIGDSCNLATDFLEHPSLPLAEVLPFEALGACDMAREDEVRRVRSKHTGRNVRKLCER